MLAAMSMRAVIVDDNAAFLEASRRTLERQGITVTGVARTITEALQRAEDLEPDLILVDIDLGDESGFELIRRLTDAAGAAAKLILISTHREDDFADLVSESAAVGFVSKSELSARAIEELLRSDGAQP
jgi:two-component system, NarL family, nitrate/nitrite response regulator NarL